MNGGGATDGDSIRTTVRNLQLGMHSQFYEVVHPLVVEALADDAHPTHRDSLQSRRLRFLADVEAFHGRQPGFFTDDYRAWIQVLRAGGAAYIGGHLYWSSQADVSSAIDDTARRATSMARCLDTALSPWRRVALHPGEPFHGVDAWTSFEPTRR